MTLPDNVIQGQFPQNNESPRSGALLKERPLPQEGQVKEETANDGEGEMGEEEEDEETSLLQKQRAEWLRLQQQRDLQFLQQLQREREEKQRLQDYAWMAYINSLPPQSREAAKAIYQYNRQMQQLAERNQMMETYVKQMEEAVLPFLKQHALSQLSQRYKVEKDLLERFAESPREATKIANLLREYRKRANFEKRKSQGNDQVAATSGQISSGTELSALKKQYQHTGKIADYVRAKKAAGLW